MSRPNATAANDAPIEKVDYAEVFFTPQRLMLEYNLSIDEAREFLGRYERWIGEAMKSAGRELIPGFACIGGILRYDDIDE